MSQNEKLTQADLPFSQEEWKAFVSRQELDQEKVVAFDNLEKFLNEHPIVIDENFDYEQERGEAINEKYGSFARLK